MCALERGVTYLLDNKFHKSSERLINSSVGERICYIVTRTVLYGVATTLRLLYMLVVMYFNTGLFVAVVCVYTYHFKHTGYIILFFCRVRYLLLLCLS